MVLLISASSFAENAVVNFSWFQDSPGLSGGSGTLTTTVADIEFIGTMPPLQVFEQKDTLIGGETFLTTGPGGEGVVGFANMPDVTQPLNTIGFYLGWEGITVNLTGVKNEGTPEEIVFTFPVQLTIEEGDALFWTAEVFDNLTPNTGTDVDGLQRWAGWVGNNGSGNRRSGTSDQTYIIGQDTFTASNGSAETPGELDFREVADGDNLGIAMALRDGTGSTVYLGDLTFGGNLQQDESGISPPLIVPGDVNGDLIVDLADFEPIRLNFGETVVGRTDGDLNEDLVVDLTDFIEFKGAFLAGGGDLADIEWVPEPATGLLLLMVAAICTVRRPSTHAFSV